MDWPSSYPKKAYPSSRETVGKRRRPLRYLLVFALLLALTSAPRSFAGRLTGAVETGFDSFIQKYSIVEEDTLDKLTEFRLRGALGYVHGSMLDDYFRFEGQGSVGQDDYEAVGRAHLAKTIGRSRLGFNGDVTLRAFRSGSVYDYANDFIRYNTQAYLLLNPIPALSLRLTDRIERMDFERRTLFDRDYVQNTFGIAGDVEGGESTVYHGAVSYSVRAVPDSTQIGYDGYSALLEFRRYFGPHRQLFLTFGGERRIYSNETVRSPFWSAVSNAAVTPVVFGNLGVSIDNSLEACIYDTDTDVYFDYVENRTGLSLYHFRSAGLRIGGGPTVQFLTSTRSPQDEYVEYGFRLSLEVIRSEALWLSAGYEPGARDYKIDDVPDNEAVFSDYTVHRVLVYASARVFRNTSVDLLLNYEPEDHDRRDDDSTVTLFSIGVRHVFR